MPRPLPSRRAALKTLGATASAVALVPWLSDEGLLAYARIQASNAPAKPLVFTPAQFATLEAFVDTLIPADDRSPGAREARVADYIDLLLSESDEDARATWARGLAALDDAARKQAGRAYADLAPDAMDKLVTEISRNERAANSPLERFFVSAKAATIQGYYTSEIGIHRELQYKGNQWISEFVGCQTEDGNDCPHCGQKAQG